MQEIDGAAILAQEIINGVLQSGSLTSLSGGNWKVLYTDASGNGQELALGTNRQVLMSSGASSAPTFTDPLYHSAVLSTNETYQGETKAATVDDASAVFGNALYLAADFNYERCDASAAATMPCTALALESGSGSKLVLLEGQICDTDWNWSAGTIYVSLTTGALTQTAPSASGEQVQAVGWALSADTMYFKPDSTLLELT